MPLGDRIMDFHNLDVPTMVTNVPVTTMTEPPVLEERSRCFSPKHTFDRYKHQDVYHIGVHATHSFEATFAEYNTTFSEYLTATAGQRFDPPIKFDMVPYTFDGIFDAIEHDQLDFMFTSPSIYSCIGIEVGAAALGTIITHEEVRGKVYDLDVFAGVMTTRADNYDIETIQDLKGKIIGAGAISQLAGGQLQFYEMEREGLSFVNDPKQGKDMDVMNLSTYSSFFSFTLRNPLPFSLFRFQTEQLYLRVIKQTLCEES